MKSRSIIGLALFVFANTVFADVTGSETKKLTFGVVPQQSASKLARIWGPILAEVSKRAGVTVRFRTAKNIPEFEKRLAAGEYDFAYMNPYHYTTFSQSPGYRAVGKARDKQIKGIVVVRKDSLINALTELGGSTLAFPAPAAFAATVLPRAHFSQAQIDVSPSYVSSHDSVYRAVAKGLYPAGGGVMRTLNTLDPKIREQLRVLWKTKAYTSHAIAVHPEVSGQTRKRVTNALLSIESTAEGMALLKALAWKGIESADDARWNDVRALEIHELDTLVVGD